MPIFSIPRAGVLLSGMVFLFVLLCGRVAWLQTYGGQRTILQADRQQHMNMLLPARRGGIFDRNGILMAGSIQNETLFVDPKFMADEFDRNGQGKTGMDAALTSLAQVMGQDPNQVIKTIDADPNKRYVKLAEDLDTDACAEIDKLDLPGIGFAPTSRRVYPMGSIACHILGGVGGDGNGIEGLELQYNKILAGDDGYERLTKDARRRPIGVAAEDYLPPTQGQHLVLTIDSNLQMFAEEELNGACTQFKAQRGEVILIDPYTGAILAMADWLKGYPGFNPGELSDSPQNARRNFAVTDPYEPGSTFKPFLAGPALMWGITTPQEVWPVQHGHYIAPDGRHVSDVESYSDLCTWDGLVKSSNCLMSMLAERMGNPRIYQAVTTFGFGTRTGIDLPGENGGKVRPLVKWSRFSTESVAQGYEVMVTPIQLARAFSAYANGGKLIQPHVLEGTLDVNGEVLSRAPRIPFDRLPRVISPQTVLEMRRILSDVVIRGTARGNRSPIWNISGKTGTSYISLGKAGYSPNRYNSSFMACAPMENPRLVVVMIVHDPGTALHFGGDVAAPAACRLLERALTYMDVPPSPPLPLPPPEVAEKLIAFQPNQITDRNYGVRAAPQPIASAEPQ